MSLSPGELSKAMRGTRAIKTFFPNLQVLESMKEPHAVLAFLTIQEVVEEKGSVTPDDIRRCFDHLRLGIGSDGIMRRME